MPQGPVIVVHGGAGSLPNEEDRRLYQVGVTDALRIGVAALERGAREAVREAVMHLEAHTITNAGRGAALARDGTVALDAGFMLGADRRYGGVTGVDDTMHPVCLAEHLTAGGEYGRLLAPPGVAGLAGRLGVPTCPSADLITDRARRLHAERLAAAAPAAGTTPWLDTVGAVAIDADGRTAAAVSTGGMSCKASGRVGDSPVVGAGFWADDRFGACVTTGVGEALLRQGSARRCVQLLADGLSPEQAAARALEEVVDYPGDMRGASGLILVTRDGAVCLDHNSAEMSSGWARPTERAGSGDAFETGSWEVKAVWRRELR